MKKRLGLNNCNAETIGCKSGFTFIELLIVMAIIGTLATIAAPHFSSYIHNAKVAHAISEIKNLEKEAYAFAAGRGRFPKDLSEIGMEYYKDPWGNPYEYLPVEGAPAGKLRKDHFMVAVNTDFDLYSKGPDGVSSPPFTAKDSRDDIVRANDGDFLGPVYYY